MTNIESIKDDYKIGDAIRIVCSLGIKEGYILDITETRIKIRPFEEGRKPISISEENIQDFEEAIPPSKTSDDSNNEHSVDSTKKSTDEKSELNPSTIENSSVDNKPEIKSDTSSLNIEQRENQPDFVKGYVDLDKIQSQTSTYKHFHKQNAWKLALQKQPEPTCESRIEQYSKSYLSNPENQKFICATGFITDDYTDYGWIWDQNLESKIWFNSNDICDDQLYNMSNIVGIHVAYIKIKGLQGPKAVGICLPRSVNQLLAIVDDLLIEENTKLLAYDLLEVVLSSYPLNEDALNLKSQLNRNTIKINKHSITSPLDIRLIEETVYTGAYKAKERATPKTDNKKSQTEYKRAKFLINEKKHEEALLHYLEAFKLEKTITLVKDITSLYCTLCGKKYTLGHPDRLKDAEKYREAGRQFLSEYAYLLPRDQSSYNFLESSYYVLQEYEKFLEVVDKIIRVRVPSQRVLFLYKKAIALLALKRKDEALDVLDEVLKIDTQNISAKRLQEQIKSNADVSEVIADLDILEVSDNPISPFLQDRIDQYKEFFGVENYIIGDEKRLYGDATYHSIENQIANASSDSQKRSLLLLTKIKLDVVRNDGSCDKRDLALYCNDMARVSMLRDPNSINWDVVRFYFNESFSLTSSWLSARRQFIQYLETLIPSKRHLIFGKLPSNLLEIRLRDDLGDYIRENDEKYDMNWIDGLLHPSQYNDDISRRIAEEIHKDSNLLLFFCKKTKLNDDAKMSEKEFLQAWVSLRDERYSKERGLVNSYLSRIKHSSLLRLNNSMEDLQSMSMVPWLFQTDKKRINDIFNVLIPKIESFILSQSYQSKEDNYHDAYMVVDNIRKDIQSNPTKFSYDALLPLLNHYHSLLEEEWYQITLTSKPDVSITLLTGSSYRDNDGLVKLQIAVSNNKESSPISKIELQLEDNKYIYSWNFEEKTYNDLLKGGDQPILYHLNMNLNPDLKEKAISITIKCIYENTNNEKETKLQDISVRLYSESEYEPFDNPYNAGDTVEKREMFFGRDSFINNLVNVMQSSPSKQLVFYGQKRSGKSSVLYWLQKELENQGAFCARFSMGILRRDLRDVTFFYQILYTITRALSRYKGEKPTFQIPKIKEFEAENPTNPVQTFSSYMAEFKDSCKSTPGWENKLIVIMIDEFTYIYTGIKEGKVDYTILQQWKSVIQDPDSSFAAVLVGQDVIPYFKEEEYARNVFQMMDDFRLNYLELSDARDLVEKPIGKHRYASGAVELILEFTACNPFYIQMLCGELVSEMNKKKSIIATTADVTEVAQKIIKRLTFEDFDNLISPGDAINVEGVSEKSTTAVLYRIAKLTETKEYCTQSDIISFYKEELIEGEENTINRVLVNLFNRDVIEEKSGLYKIKVKLFQQWMLNQKPETASLKELEE